MKFGTMRTWMVALAGTLGLTLAIGGGSALAQMGPMAPPGGMPDPCQRMTRFLTPEDREAMGTIMLTRLKAQPGLTDQQAEDLGAALRAQRDARRTDFRALCEARVEVRTLLAQQDADPGAVRAAGERVKVAQAKLLDRRLDTYLDLRAKLTPEQWAKWVELRKSVGPHRHWGMRPSAM